MCLTTWNPALQISVIYLVSVPISFQVNTFGVEIATASSAAYNQGLELIPMVSIDCVLLKSWLRE